MYGDHFRAPKVDIKDFSMTPRAEIPRSSFRMQHQHKTTFSCSLLIPIYLQEILPGDSFSVTMSAFLRLSTPLFPILDNMDLEVFFFFVPNRLVWVHWANFMGEQNSPADSITYTVPTITSIAGGFAVNSLFDYFGIPTVGQVGGGNTITVSALPFRCYNFIVQEWFRDQNLVNSMATGSVGALAAGAKWQCQSDDGPDGGANYSLFTVAKRHDYFTSALPWTQKGGTGVTLPLGTSATVKTNSSNLFTGVQTSMKIQNIAGGNMGVPGAAMLVGAVPNVDSQTTATLVSGGGAWYPSNLYADLSTATAATINAIRLAFQTQRLLERDARAGTRYSETILAHFGVRTPDASHRPEYLGGGKFPIVCSPVPQTTATGLTGGTSPLGTLAAAGTGRGSAGYRHSFTEHGHVLGLCCVRNDKVYQQGIRKLFSRSTRYDFYLPVLAHLGEQSILNKEIFADGSANDALTFGYIPRWDEYRYHPSFTSGFFRSTSATPLDSWHLAQKFAALPALNNTFIADDLSVTIERSLAAAAQSLNQQILADFFFDEKCARLMPMHSVPGMVDHF